MIKKLRIITGLILFAFVAMHLVNIAMGLSSVALMERAQPWLLGIWSNVVVAPILMVAFLVHMGLGLQAVYRRNTLQIKRNDIVQIVSSLILVPLLIPHLVGTYVVREFFGLPQDYPGILMLFWYYEPAEGLRQVVLLAATWIHGCIGLFIWLRLQPWWSKVSLFLSPLAVALPVFAMLGYVEGGKAVMSGAVEVVYAQPPEGGMSLDEILVRLDQIKYWLIGLFLLIVVLVLVARWWRLMGHDGATRVHYVGQPAYTAENGLTLLESATVNDIPHAALCGGRGRCGTCRVRVVKTSEELASASDEELHTLARIGAAGDVRLACQLKVAGGHLEVERLLPPYLKHSELSRTHGGAEALRGRKDGALEAAE
ncbi:MAG: 2Fe-2S iron-sulfur cluster-binding protein [Rhizobiaceae bacterium]